MITRKKKELSLSLWASVHDSVVKKKCNWNFHNSELNKELKQTEAYQSMTKLASIITKDVVKEVAVLTGFRSSK